jgi:hypothetical protein
MSRRTHLVGAWPGYSAPHAMDVAFARLGPWLDRLSDGEVGLRSQWVTPVLEAMRANPDVEITQEGDYTTYDRTPKFKVKDGAHLDPANIVLGIRHAFEASYPQFKELRKRHQREGIRFQVGVPSPIDFAIVCFGPEGFADPSLAEAFLGAEIRELSEIATLADPEDVVFQLETIIALPAAAMSPTPDQHQMEGDSGDMVERVAGLFAAVAAGTPPRTHFGMHLCLGDFNHVAFSRMLNAEPIVRVVNAVVARWPEGHPLDYIHVPLAAAAEPPSLEPDFYAPLAGLELPPDVRLAAGFVHEHLDEAGHEQLLSVIESAAGREVDIAATCGLGRRPTLEEAWDAMNKSRTLLEAHG